MTRLHRCGNLSYRGLSSVAPVKSKATSLRIAPLLRNKEVFLDLDVNTLCVRRQLEKLKCVVHTLPQNISKSTSVFISSKPIQTYVRARPQLTLRKLMKQTRGSRALQNALKNTNPISSKTQAPSNFSKAQALNPKIKFHYYPHIKAQLDREVRPNEPHEHRFEFDITHIKSKYPDACQYFITDAKGVHKIEPHIIRFPPKIYLDHPCSYKGSYFQKPKKFSNVDVSNKKKNQPRKRHRKICDGCMHWYLDLEAHHKSKEHQDWYKSTNFDDIDQLIKEVHAKVEEEERRGRARMKEKKKKAALLKKSKAALRKEKWEAQQTYIQAQKEKKDTEKQWAYHKSADTQKEKEVKEAMTQQEDPEAAAEMSIEVSKIETQKEKLFEETLVKWGDPAAEAGEGTKASKMKDAKFTEQDVEMMKQENFTLQVKSNDKDSFVAIHENEKLRARTKIASAEKPSTKSIEEKVVPKIKTHNQAPSPFASPYYFEAFVNSMDETSSSEETLITRNRGNKTPLARKLITCEDSGSSDDTPIIPFNLGPPNSTLVNQPSVSQTCRTMTSLCERTNPKDTKKRMVKLRANAVTVKTLATTNCDSHTAQGRLSKPNNYHKHQKYRESVEKKTTPTTTKQKVLPSSKRSSSQLQVIKRSAALKKKSLAVNKSVFLRRKAVLNNKITHFFKSNGRKKKKRTRRAGSDSVKRSKSSIAKYSNNRQKLNFRRKPKSLSVPSTGSRQESRSEGTLSLSCEEFSPIPKKRKRMAVYALERRKSDDTSKKKDNLYMTKFIKSMCLGTQKRKLKHKKRKKLDKHGSLNQGSSSSMLKSGVEIKKVKNINASAMDYSNKENLNLEKDSIIDKSWDVPLSRKSKKKRKISSSVHERSKRLKKRRQSKSRSSKSRSRKLQRTCIKTDPWNYKRVLSRSPKSSMSPTKRTPSPLIEILCNPQ